jgi:FdhD protein
MSVPIVEERAVKMLLNGEQYSEWACTPTDLDALAVGRLFIDGQITRADHAYLDIATDDEVVLIRARTDGAHSHAVSRVNSGPAIPPTERFAELFRTMFANADARHPHGGMHVAAATDGRSVVTQVEDVGRHNTIDKITGALLLARLDPRKYGLLLSARVSGLITTKASRANFAWIASRSIPTTMAAETAHRTGLTIIGRAASRDAHHYK